MELAAKLLTVLGLSFFELWAAIPAGLALGLDPLLTAVGTSIGAILGVLAVVLLGGRLRNWLLQRRGAGEGRHGRIQGIWNRWGVVGLGLLAPLLTGAPLGAALGVALGAPAGRLILWMSVGVVVWSVGLTLVGVLGIAGFEAIRR